MQANIAERKEWSNLRRSLEDKVADATKLHDSLQAALKRAQSENIELERDLTRQVESARREGSSGGEWKGRYEELERTHHSLTSELREQQQVTDEVRRQASEHLREMKLLSDEGHHASEREEKLALRLSHLEDEVQSWKNRYLRAKTRAGSGPSSANGLAIQPPSAKKAARESGFQSATGLVKEMHVTHFQLAIDELLHVARNREPSSVLDQMKPVVIALKQITQSVGQPQGAQQKLLMRVAATANNLITASKNFSSSNGLSPVSLVDAAASHLAAAVIELLRLVQVRPTQPGDLDADDKSLSSRAVSRDYHSGRNGPHEVESVYSTMSTPLNTSAHASRSMDRDLATLPATRHAMPNGKVPQTNPPAPNGARALNEDVEELKVSLPFITTHTHTSQHTHTHTHFSTHTHTHLYGRGRQKSCDRTPSCFSLH